MAKYRISSDVIAEFRDDGSRPAFWEYRWLGTDFDGFLKRYETGFLEELGPILLKYLTKGEVLEAGCGRGQFVCALASLGFDVSGVDFSAELIASVKRARPNLNVSVGNVLDLRREDGSLAAYLSFGVIEHFWDDSDAILREAYRVLAQDGLAIVSVPHLNQNLNKQAFPPVPNEPGDFYQFYFTQDEFGRKIRAAGFDPLEFFYYSRIPGLKRAFPKYDTIQRRSYLIRGSMRHLSRLPMPQSLLAKFSHMILCVAKKT